MLQDLLDGNKVC